MTKPSLLIAIVTLIGTGLVWVQPAAAAAGRQAPTEMDSHVDARPGAETRELLAQIDSAVQQSVGDLSRLRIERWKIDGASKRQARASAEAIQRNLTRAVPELLQRAGAEPNAVSPSFRLYRDLTVLCETFSSLVERAGVYGPPDEYSAIASDLSQLDKLRYRLGDQLDQLTQSTDAEVARLRAHVETVPARKVGRSASHPTRIVIDENHPKRRTKHWHKPAGKHEPAKHEPARHSTAKPSAAHAEPARP